MQAAHNIKILYLFSLVEWTRRGVFLEDVLVIILRDIKLKLNFLTSSAAVCIGEKSGKSLWPVIRRMMTSSTIMLLDVMQSS